MPPTFKCYVKFPKLILQVSKQAIPRGYRTHYISGLNSSSETGREDIKTHG